MYYASIVLYYYAKKGKPPYLLPQKQDSTFGSKKSRVERISSLQKYASSTVIKRILLLALFGMSMYLLYKILTDIRNRNNEPIDQIESTAHSHNTGKG